MSEVNIKKCVLKSDYGIKDLNDIKSIIEYITSDKFMEDYRGMFNFDNVDVNNKTGELWIGTTYPRFWIECKKKDREGNWYLKDIGELWYNCPTLWGYEITPFLNVNVNEDDWIKTREEFIDKWNEYWGDRDKEKCIRDEDRDRLISVGFEDVLRVL